MFISPAFAQGAGGADSGTGMLVLLIPIILIMYFLIIRPQRQQMKQRQEMLNSVRRGDTVVTGGGIVGKVTKTYDESGELEVEISDGVKIRVLRSTLSDVRRVEATEQKTVSSSKNRDNKKKVQKTNKQVNKDKSVEKTTETKENNNSEKNVKNEADNGDTKQ